MLVLLQSRSDPGRTNLHFRCLFGSRKKGEAELQQTSPPASHTLGILAPKNVPQACPVEGESWGISAVFRMHVLDRILDRSCVLFVQVISGVPFEDRITLIQEDLLLSTRSLYIPLQYLSSTFIS